MRLSEVVIQNFCSCEAVTVPLSDFNPIVGYNNSGKSNILRAINWLLKKSVLPSHMFNKADEAVIVEGVIPLSQTTCRATIIADDPRRSAKNEKKSTLN